MKSICLIVFTLFTFSLSFGQIGIRGQIVDDSTKLPLEMVSVSIKNTTKGTTTNKSGYFSLDKVTLPVTLLISHIAYEAQEIYVSTKDIISDVIDLNIFLIARINSLGTLTINASPVQQLERLVYDFEVTDSNLYLICNKKDKRMLQVYDFNDFLKRSQILPKGCSEIGFDCLKYIYAKKTNATDYWRISLKDTSLIYTEYDSVLEGVGRIIANTDCFVQNKSDSFEKWYADFYKHNNRYKVNTLVGNGVHLIGCFDSGIYFSNQGWWKQYTELYRIYLNRNGELRYNKVYYAFFDIDDWLNPAIENPTDSIKILGNIKISKYVANQLQLLRKSGDITEAYIQRVIKTPMRNIVTLELNPLHLFVTYMLQLQAVPVYFITTNKHLFIFNCDKGYIYQLDENNYLQSVVKMEKSIANDFGCDIVFNVESNRCFIRYNKGNGYVTLKELDLQTGKYIKTIDLLKSRIEKIRIVDSYIYYTAVVEGRNAMERRLYKQKLE
ncbi:MAG: carboxypeptidase-like regulatory domain-containing protein [Bacteroidales bacterium]|jgi:hypothetical protein|nr:carboxypeptidase-like regulatory domain-containing protein [Bacteroidales bacterium]